MNSKQYFLGVDGGQSSTVALIADETGRVVGSGRGGPCNHTTGEAGRIKFFDAVGSCLQQACRGASLDAQTIEFEAACLGFSGGAADKDAYSRELIRSKRFEITHDAAIALMGAHAGAPGVIVIAGTGSMAFGRDAEGRTARAGGWGYIYGDEGGAFDIARRGLRAALRMEEGWGPRTSLHAALLQATGAPDANTLLHDWYKPGVNRQEIAALAKLVSEAADQGDGVAENILMEAAQALVPYAEGVGNYLFPDAQTVRVAYIGGVFQNELFRETFASAMQKYNWHLETVAPLMSPAAGAVLTALRLTGKNSSLTGAPASIK